MANITLLVVVLLWLLFAVTATFVSTYETSFEIKQGLTTIAGTSTSGYGGDGGLATIAKLSAPFGLTSTQSGELIISDSANNRIRKVLLDKTIITIAGIGSPGYGGDGGLAVDAQLYSPYGTVVTPSGEIIISDTSNHRIRKILLDKTIITIAGTGLPGFTGDGGLATNAYLQNPRGITMTSSGEIIFADSANHRIRKILLDKTIITIAGNGGGSGGNGGLATNAQFYFPYGIAINSLGEMWIADNGNHILRKIFANHTIIAINAQLYYPRGVAVTSSGEVYIADTYKHRIRKITLNDSIITVAGITDSPGKGLDGLALATQLSNPSAITVTQQGEVLIGDDIKVRRMKLGCPSFSTLLNNNCTCFDGYYGTTSYSCDMFKCNNITFNDMKVCSSKGVCASPNNCTCNPGYYGTYCELYTCYGIPKISGKACSGIGVCVGLDTCECPKSTSIIYNSNCSQTPNDTRINQDPSNVVVSPNDLVTILIASIVPSISIVLIIIIIIILIIIVITIRKRKKKDLDNPDSSQFIQLKSMPNSNFPSLNNSSKISNDSQYDPMERYTDMIKIGQGGFGSVYKVKDTKSGNETKAIKVIRFESTEDLNMAMREGIQLLKMNHPNILKVNNFFIGTNQVLCIDMLYYELGDLNKLIYNLEFCSENLVKQILYQSCSALDYIFKNFGIIHRDIKPSNIFIQRLDVSNSTIEIVIADFGLAKNTKESITVSFAGTPMFISPELLCGINCDDKTDIFSLGVTFYQMISHDMVTSVNGLYMSQDSESVIQILKGKMNSKYSTELVDLVLSMLEKDVTKRPNAHSILQNNYFKTL